MTLAGKAIRGHRVSGGANDESGCSAVANVGVPAKSPPGHRVGGAVTETQARQSNRGQSRKRLAHRGTHAGGLPARGWGAGAAGSRRRTEVTAIHSVAGLLSGSTPLITRPPFVAPHHTSSVAALVGGGSGLARPGAVSRAHRGVLFLDECAEIGVSALEALRTPLEDGEIRLARRDGVARYPARFQLVLAANPCPCAPADPRDCICAPAAKRRYLGKLSGPLLDRVDLRVQMHPVRAGAFSVPDGESTARVRERVAAARMAAVSRWQPHGIGTNAEVSGALLRRKFRPEAAAMAPLRTALDRGLLSVRGVDRTLRVAWTLCDLAGRSSPGLDEVTAALSFRQAGSGR